ncbi:AAA family ATPase, partial [Candidatus Geothermarchaeota archaeon]
HLVIEPPKGVLHYGPPGCGKTLLARAVANESGAHFIVVNGPEIMSKWYGESEKRLRDIFEEARENAPSIIFIDEIDSIAPKREEVAGEVEKRVVSQLLALMDGLEARGDVIVIAATNRPEALDPALRRPGRFDREIRIGVPDKNGRKEILQIHTRNMPLADDVNLEELARITHGFVGADLAALCREAAMNALRRFLPQIDLEKEVIPTDILEKLKVTMQDFNEALKYIQPSALREVFLEIPEVRWDDIGGLEDVKRQLKEAVEWPIKYPDLFKRLGVRSSKGILLFGPPGTGKTLLAKAAATESEANFVAVRGPEILSKWVGESEKAVRKIFSLARQSAPCIIFFDELDAIAPRRGMDISSSGVTERIVNQLLSEMDGIQELKGVVVIGATNRPDILDPALLRPGRFDKVIYVPPPNLEARYEIFKIHTRNMPLADDVDLRRLAELTDGYTGADIEAVCLEAALSAAREDIRAKEIRMIHFEKALKIVPPSISPAMVREYERLAEKISRRAAY